MNLSPLYPIVDFSCFAAQSDPISAVLTYASELLKAGSTIIQFRDKQSSPQDVLSVARELRRVTRNRAKLIINDYPDLCLAAGADGVHLGQDDLSPTAVRGIFEAAKKDYLWIGYSTHNLDQARAADAMPIDYLAVGPVFSTSSKVNPDPVIGLDSVRNIKQYTTKSLVAIGGITRGNCHQVRAAGADSVAVISDLLESPAKAVEDFLRILG